MNRKTIIIILALTATTITTMGLFNFFRGNNNRFVTEKQFNDNVAKQKQMNSQTLEQLIKYGITDTSELKLEFFFYTNEQEKASKLAIELKKLNYEIDHVDTSASGKKEWIVSGWSTKIRMDLKTVTNWTTQMCKLGFDNDCEFDGWGTLPDQDVEVEKNLTAEQYYDKGLDLYHDNQLRKSELYFSEAIKLDPSFPVSFYNRAMIRTDLGNKKQAIEDYTAAIKLKHDYHEAYENRGALKDELGDYDGAISDYTAGLKINPKSSVAYSNRGNSKYRKGDETGACADWKQALALGDIDAQSKLDEYCK